jgi:hypothetical protein
MSIPSRINSVLETALGIRVSRPNLHGPEPGLCERSTPFSAHGEELVLLKYLADLPDIDRSYADIGAGDGMHMSNTARLALNGWRGVGFELNRNQATVMATAYRRFDRVFVCQARVTPENACDFLTAYALPKHFGVLSLDIDSYDYFVLDAVLSHFRPTIVVTEINEKFPPPLRFTVCPGGQTQYGRAHFYGASISQMAALAERHRYTSVRLEYNNLFLIASEHCRVPGLSARAAYDQGYRLRPDRQTLFPWNANMEPLLGMGREDALQFVRNRYAGREAEYRLAWADDPDGA